MSPNRFRHSKHRFTSLETGGAATAAPSTVPSPPFPSAGVAEPGDQIEGADPGEHALSVAGLPGKPQLLRQRGAWSSVSSSRWAINPFLFFSIAIGIGVGEERDDGAEENAWLISL